MSGFVPEDEFTPPHEQWEEFIQRVRERLEERGTIEDTDPFDALTTVLADIHIGVQQAYIIVRAIREELENLSE